MADPMPVPLTVLAQYAEQGLYNSQVSVRPSVRLSLCMSHHLTTAAACGSFAAECRVGRIYQLTAESAGLPAATALQHGAAVWRSAAKCRQCHVDEAEHRLVCKSKKVTKHCIHNHM